MNVAAFLLAICVGVPLAYLAATLPFKAWDWLEAHSGGLTGQHMSLAAFMLVWAAVAWL